MFKSRKSQRIALFAGGAALCAVLMVSPALTAAKEIEPAADAEMQTAAGPMPELPAALLQMAALPPSEPAPSSLSVAPPPHSQPFGYASSAPATDTVAKRWHAVKMMLLLEQRIMQPCRANMAACPAEAKAFLRIIDKAATRKPRERIAEINRAINLAIRPVDDIVQYGVEEFWASPLTTFASRAGDCEDYAIAKYVALRETGFADEDVRLVVVRDHEANQGHAVTAVRHDGHWLVLDNMRRNVEDAMEITRLTPRYFIDDAGVTAAVEPSPDSGSGLPQLALASVQIAPI